MTELKQSEQNRMYTLIRAMRDYGSQSDQYWDLRDSQDHIEKMLETHQERVEKTEFKASQKFVEFFFRNFDPTQFQWKKVDKFVRLRAGVDPIRISIGGFSCTNDWLNQLYDVFSIVCESNEYDRNFAYGGLYMFTDPMDGVQPPYLRITRRKFKGDYRYKVEFDFTNKSWFNAYVRTTGIEVK
mgnify:CR=1 FL=1